MDLTNKHVLITGASAGIGKALAYEFHAQGAKVILIARRQAELEQICEELNLKRGGSASLIVCDLTAKDCDEALSLDEFLASFDLSSVDVLVNNAGRGSFGDFDSQNINHEVQMIELNLTAPVKLTHAVIPFMKKRGSGGIINISSVAGFQPVPMMAVYSGTKAFNYSFSMALRQELSSFGIRVLTICPGPTATEFGTTEDMGNQRAAVWDTAEDVARDTVNALLANRAWIVTARWSRLMALPCRLLPKSLTTWLAGWSTRNR